LVNPDDPYEAISAESLFGYLEGLTSIQPYSGWRNSATRGEAEALDYVQGKLNDFASLKSGGMALERQSFDVYLGTEIWDAGLTLSVNGRQVEVPAEGLRGSRYNRFRAVYFDTDGVFNDSDPDPVTAAGAPLVVLDEDTLYSLSGSKLKDRVLFLDYSLIDRVTNIATGDGRRMGAYENSARLVNMVDQGLAGMVLVTKYSNKSTESHGSFISEGSLFGMDAYPTARIPILFVRLEDLSPAGIETWEDLEQIESARLVLDSDVFFPARSGNLVARIPGVDTSRAVILGSHIDTPNVPGAFDDGSGSAALLEIARVLDVTRVQPPVDLYLAWFGSEELGVYGSAYFASTHQDLLDRTLVMLQMDGLGHPLEGRDSTITLLLASYARQGDDRLLLPDFLSADSASRGMVVDRFVSYAIDSDNNNFDTFNVPNANLIYLNSRDLNNAARPVHYTIHFHDPYETVALAREVGDVFVEMTRVMLAAGLEIGRLQPELRNALPGDRRALIVASHTEAFGLTMLRELGMELSWEGFDVDLVPYGQSVTPHDLENVDVVILPPGLNSTGRPIETWGDSEIAVLTNYVAAGGLLVVVNSANTYATTILMDNPNRNARSVNALLAPMGIRFKYGQIGGESIALEVSDHPLTVDAAYLSYFEYNGVPFDMDAGQQLLSSAGKSVVGLVDYGEQGGQVLVIADIGILQCSVAVGKNLQFLQNLAQFILTR